MAKNTLKQDRRGFIKHRTQYYDTFSKAWLKRDTLTGLIVGIKDSGPWKGVRLEKGATTCVFDNKTDKVIDASAA